MSSPALRKLRQGKKTILTMVIHNKKRSTSLGSQTLRMKQRFLSVPLQVLLTCQVAAHHCLLRIKKLKLLPVLAYFVEGGGHVSSLV